MKPLKNDTRGRGYCGPTAVACITGKPLSKVLDTMRAARGRPGPVRGTGPSLVGRSLDALGWSATPIRIHHPSGGGWSVRPTVAAYLRSRTKDLMNVHLLMIVGTFSGGGHWIVVKGRKMVDTFTKGEPVFISKAPHRRCRVHAVYRVTRKAAKVTTPA